MPSIDSLPQTFGYDVSQCGTVDEKLNAAKLDWQVLTSPVEYAGGLVDDSHKVAYRSDNNKVLDIYGKSRIPYQNNDIVSKFDEFCDVNNLKMGRLGAINGGKEMIAIAPMPMDFRVGSDDEFVSYLILRESHKLGSGLNVVATTERLACLNMLRTCELKYSVRHSMNGIHQIQEAMDKAKKSVENYKIQANRLAKVSMDDSEALAILIASFGDPTLSVSEQPKAVMSIYALYKGGGLGSDKLTAFNTAFGLLEAVKEHMTWEQNRSTVNRLDAVTFGSRDSKIQKVRQQLTSAYLS